MPTSSRNARRILWRLVKGSRSQRNAKVHALMRLGYSTPPKDLADEIKRDFHLKVVMRPRLNASRRRIQCGQVLPDGFGRFVEWKDVNPIKFAHMKEQLEAEYRAVTGDTLIIDEILPLL